MSLLRSLQTYILLHLTLKPAGSGPSEFPNKTGGDFGTGERLSTGLNSSEGPPMGGSSVDRTGIATRASIGNHGAQGNGIPPSLVQRLSNPIFFPHGLPARDDQPFFPVHKWHLSPAPIKRRSRITLIAEGIHNFCRKKRSLRVESNSVVIT